MQPLYYLLISLFSRRYWLEWESPIHTILVLILFVVACQFFEPYMAPIALLLVFLKYYLAHTWGAVKTVSGDEDDEQQADEDDQQQDDQPDDQDDEKSKVTPLNVYSMSYRKIEMGT